MIGEIIPESCIHLCEEPVWKRNAGHDWREYVERKQVPGVGRAAQTHGDWDRVEPTWWPNQLNLKILHQNSPLSDPMGKEFNYAEEFATLDLDALKKDIDALISSGSQTSSRPPAKPSGAEGILEFPGRCRSSSLARSPSRLASLASGSLDRTSTPCAAG